MYLVVFRSKSETYKFSSLLGSYGVKNVIVSTPKQISASCGVSCKIDASNVDRALFVLNRRQKVVVKSQLHLEYWKESLKEKE